MTERIDPQSGASRRVAGAAGIMMLSIFASRVLGLIRDGVISGKFGQGAQSDVYYAAFVVPDLLFFLIAGGALSSAFIPVYSEKVALGQDDRAWRLFSIVATVMTLVVGAFIVIGEVFAPSLVALTNFGFKADLVAQVTPLTRILLPAQLCFFIGGLMMGAQQARGSFLVPALGPNIYNLGIIAGGLLLTSRLGQAGLCWGAVIGAVAGNMVLQYWGLRKHGLRYRPSLAWRDPDAMRVWKLMLPVILGLALPQVSIQFNKMFATTLGEGPQSALTRANMLMQAPLAIFGQALAVAIFPTMSSQAALAQWDQLRSTAASGIRLILFLTIPSSVLMIVLAHPIVALLLQHGRFTAEDTHMAASALVVYCVGIFAWSAQAVLSRGFYALQDTVTPVVVGTAVTAVFIPLNLLFMRTFHMGYRGLALATSVAAVLHMAAMTVVLSRRLGGMEGRRGLAAAVQVSVASALAGGACWGAARIAGLAWQANHGVAVVKMGSLAEIAAGLGVGVLIYGAAARAMRIPELTLIGSVLRRSSVPRQAIK